ncbi:MAG: SpoIIE family protein phosphatase, partial [Planctomycetota bacterium]|nr:SpoIIE family protein phosphatase [Planctomycetota bacterium]
VGWASVFLDAAAIEQVRKKTNKDILIITIIGAIVSVIIIVLIATIFTQPIRQLQADVTKVAEGNLGHRTSVATNDEIGALATVFDVMTSNLRAAQAQEADRKAIERELSIANEIQNKLLPDRIPQIPGFDINRFYESAKEVGGDYYDFLVIDQRHLGIVVADVSGKGIPGSMVMTMVRSLLRLASVRNFSPADTFKKVNRILAKDIRRGMFVTAIYMVLDIVDKKLKVASAGHNPLVVYRADSGKVELVKPKGIALGFDKGPIFDSHIREVEIELRPGDRITAFTDGVNEAMDKNEEEFGDERFYELVRQTAQLNSEEFIDKIIAAIAQHRGDFEQSDDITLATLSVLK